MARRILICDDQVHIVRVAQFKLASAGFEVRQVFNGLDAWNLIQACPPDLLITDLQMPGLNGFQVIQRMRQHPQTKAVPVILLTAKGYELRDQNLIDGLGDVEVISKPFSPRALLQLVNQKLAASVPAAAIEEAIQAGGIEIGESHAI